MNRMIKRVVVLGGGTAGWITAGLLAAEHCGANACGLQVVLVESPDIPVIGVGEGTWPTIRNTLRKIGLNETQLFRECDASFKQGAKFCGWETGKAGEFYYHPLMVPEGYGEVDLARGWQEEEVSASFADRVNFQSLLCERGLAPKLMTTPEYAAIANYAYHINAGKLGKLLARHCQEKLGVVHHRVKIDGVRSHNNGDIAALLREGGGEIPGDLFIDCSGSAARLIGQHFQVPFMSCINLLFNNRAVAVQVPYARENDPIASHTIGAAQKGGWIWDIGLPTRKGVGYVYSSAHIEDDAAYEALRVYLGQCLPAQQVDTLTYRQLTFEPGHRAKFWHKNCVAVGMAAGFVEPLEASALVLVEMAAAMISDDLPVDRAVMDTIAQRYNRRFEYRWAGIIDFLKLHYAISKRDDTTYWRDHTREATTSERLQEWLQLWSRQPPCKHDFPLVEEVFASASWQYVLYGMGFKTQPRPTRHRAHNTEDYQKLITQNKNFARQCFSALPKNRELVEKIQRYGLQRV
ncbi:tryptophan halogenase family protein [uncultured Microbulbifer sp.]|uniref:tryptophan halogenase family protein n=1 Tax=uncultured Microbulbifer sp. TaxID=348147 RepID=UPI0026368F47|nr:tryptophan halogenase family protein [uncultured Microbulbifer sp.]